MCGLSVAVLCSVLGLSIYNGLHGPESLTCTPSRPSQRPYRHGSLAWVMPTAPTLPSPFSPLSRVPHPLIPFITKEREEVAMWSCCLYSKRVRCVCSIC